MKLLHSLGVGRIFRSVRKTCHEDMLKDFQCKAGGLIQGPTRDIDSQLDDSFVQNRVLVDNEYEYTSPLLEDLTNLKVTLQ